MTAPTTDRRVTNRSHEFIASFQLDAMCETLRFLLASQLEPSVLAHQLVKRLRDDFVTFGSGRAVEAIPEITEQMSPVDLYLAAEFLRYTLSAFLTPDEREERGPFGLHPNRPNKS
jgi:hypothetical protein